MLITNFASGELSDKLSGRVDLPQYFQGAGYIENFEIQPTGGAFRRVGFKRILTLQGQCRLIPFIVNKSFSFLLVFYAGTPNGKCEILKASDLSKVNCTMYSVKKDVEGMAILDDNGNIQLEAGTTQNYLNTEYTAFTDIQEMQYAQNYNIIIFVHKKHRPFALRYNISDNTFTWSPLYFDFSPDCNIANPYTGDTKDPFADDSTATHKYKVQYGRLYKDSTDVDNSDITVTSAQDARATGYKKEKIFNGEGEYPSAIAFFNSRLWLAGSVNEPQRIYASRPQNTHRADYNDFSTYEKNIVVEKVTSSPELLTFSGDIAQGSKRSIVNVSNKAKIKEYIEKHKTQDGKKIYVYNEEILPLDVELNSLTDSTIAISKDAKDTAFKEKSVAGKDSEGKPTVNTVKDDVHGKVFTLSLWRDPTTPTTDDYDFTVVSQNVVLADSSFSFEIASEQNDAIKWLSGGDTLLIGTESGIWQVPQETNALNIKATNPTRNGSDDIQALRIDNATVFFSQGKRSIKEYYRGEQSTEFRTNNLAFLAEQMLFESSAIDFDYISNPCYKIIVTREDGRIVTLLYDKSAGILSWTRTRHGGGENTPCKFTSCATLRGEEENDIVYQVVEYKNADNTKSYYLEKLDSAEGVFLDGYEEITTENPISTLAPKYTADAIVIINHADGTQDVKTKDEATAINGLILKENDKAYIGYEYTSKIVSLPIVAGDPSGKKRIVNLLIRFLKSYFPIMKCDEKEEFFTDAEEPYTGYKYIDYPQNSDRDVIFELEYKAAHPCNILCIQANLA